MKVKFAIIALIILGLSACTQRTCPTYAKSNNDASKPAVEVEANV